MMMVAVVAVAVATRNGIILDDEGHVFFQEDNLIGIMPYVDGPTEVLNTAVLSAQKISKSTKPN